MRAERAAILHGDSTGKTHKILQMSYLRYETKNAISRLLFGPPKQNKYKDADESEKQTKNKNVNDTKQLFIAYF